MAKGALVIAIGKGKPKGEDEDESGSYFGDKPKGEEGEGDADSEATAADELADTLGVPDDKREDFKSALGSYVDLCVAKAMKDQ